MWNTIRRSSIIALAVLALGAQQPSACPDCPDPSRPWMRGTVEIGCAIPRELAAAKQAAPEKNIVACHCQHRCSPLADHADVTDDRDWDPQCSARCSPKGCTCPHPCES